MTERTPFLRILPNVMGVGGVCIDGENITIASIQPPGHISNMAHLARNILRKVIHAAAITALLAGTASAQLSIPGVNLLGDNPPLTPQEEEKRKATEDAYKSALKKIPDKQQKSADPWENIRPNSSTASKTKQGQH